MLPLFVLADSDIDEEELKPVLVKLKRKLRKTSKTRNRTSTKRRFLLEGENISIDSSSAGNIIDVCSERTSEGLISNNCDTNSRNSSIPTSSPNGLLKKRKRSTKTYAESKKARCSSCCPQLSCSSPTIEVRQHGTCLCELGQIACTSVTGNSSDFTSRIVALDCEFVGVGPKKTSALGRCTVVDYSGRVLLDLYARPEEPITDYRTPWSGLRPKDLVDAVPFECARRIICDVLQDKIVVGHAVFNDFRVLQIRHPRECIRDTSSCKPLRDMAVATSTQGLSLKRLSKALLGRDIQMGEHCSSEDAIAALDLYKLVQSEWEEMLVGRETKRSQKMNQSQRRTFSDISYLGDEFWPSALFESPSI